MVDWSKVPVMTQGPSREEEAAQREQQAGARGQLEQALFPTTVVQQSIPTSLPETGGLLGGVAAVVFPELRPIAALTRAAPSIVRPFVPSLVGSTAGTVAGTLGEQAITGKDILSSDTAKKVLANSVSNAAFDVGGNLVFSALGKAIKIGKGELDNLGITKGLFDTEEGAARRAAQEWLSQRGATLNKGQLTGTVLDQATVGTLKSSAGAGEFRKQEEGVNKALQQGAQDVQSTLETSDAFKMALKTNDPTQMAVGDRFQSAMAAAETAMKDKYRPTFEKIDADMGLQVSLLPLKQEAQKELDTLAKRKFAGAGAERKKALEEIIKQDDNVSLSTAHALRSDLLAGAREAVKEGVPTTALGGEYTRQAQGIRNAMDNVMVLTFGNEEEKALARKLGLIGGVDQPAGLRSGQYQAFNIDDLSKMNIGRTKATTSNNELLREYFNTQEGYKNAMKGFYNGTVSSALKSEPSAVGEYLFNIDRPERLRDAQKAIVEAQKYLPANVSKGLQAELQYGYLDKMFGSPDGIQKFAASMKDDKNFQQGFNYLFGDPKIRNQLKELANATKYGTEAGPASTYLRSKGLIETVGAGTAIGAAGVTYLTLPDEVKSKLDAATLAATGGTLYLVPKLLSKAVTNKTGMDALAMLAKAQGNPKYAGAMSAKIVDGLQKAGLIDSEYVKNVEAMLGQPKQEAPSQQAPTTMDWSKVPVEQ